jgi:hypothetical protein
MSSVTVFILLSIFVLTFGTGKEYRKEQRGTRLYIPLSQCCHGFSSIRIHELHYAVKSAYAYHHDKYTRLQTGTTSQNKIEIDDAYELLQLGEINDNVGLNNTINMVRLIMEGNFCLFVCLFVSIS